MELMAPKVSVLTTVYNREKWLPEAVQSVLTNGYDDFEIILVDDNSSDGSWRIAQEFCECDPRVRAFKNETNLGDYPNRNVAASLARGNYLKYVDSDDILLPGSLSRFVSAMDQNPEAAYAITADEDLLLQPNDTLHRALFEFKRAIGGAPGNLLIRRSHFLAAGGFENHPCTGDYELQTNLAAKYPILLVCADFVQIRTLDFNQSAIHLQTTQTRKRIHDLTLTYARNAGTLPPELRMKVCRQAKILLAREIFKEIYRFKISNYLELRRNFHAITGHGLWSSLLMKKHKSLFDVRH